MVVELEDIIKEEGPERRVDNHKLLLYLAQVSQQMTHLDGRLSTHMKAEEAHQDKVKELIDLLVSFKGFLRVAKWLGAVGAALGGAVFWLKDHLFSFWR